jgi:L-amino acid N-acyltransferase YncA
MEFMIGDMSPTDWEPVREIYREGILGENATFEADVPDWQKWDAGHLPEPRLVARVRGQVVGWAALSRVSARRVYAGVAEVSLYIDGRYQRRGIGDALLAALVQASEKSGIWTLQASIFPENQASIRLHEKHGFRIVGQRERIAKMNYGSLQGKWRDTIFMERRSRVAGND